jgi:hypothetical protein
VSVSTARRVLDLKERDPESFEELARTGKARRRAPDPKRKLPETWRVPRAIPALAAFLRERLTSTDLAQLSSLLARGA